LGVARIFDLDPKSGALAVIAVVVHPAIKVGFADDRAARDRQLVESNPHQLIPAVLVLVADQLKIARDEVDRG
jgi:hypothetical protein